MTARWTLPRTIFLKLTHEARLLSVDPRAIDPDLPDDPNTKLNVCANKVAEIYHETAEDKLAQLIFCDQGTPKFDGSFNFYEAAKAALIAQGVKPEDIAFIHDAKTDVQREKMFDRVPSGEIRVLIGSTEKMGTGMNVQKKLIALHHLDVPWRPSEEGQTLRHFYTYWRQTVREPPTNSNITLFVGGSFYSFILWVTMTVVLYVGRKPKHRHP